MPSLLKEEVDRFRAAAPVVEMLNAPLVASVTKRPMF